MPGAVAMSTSWNAKRHADATGVVEELRGLGIEHLEAGYLMGLTQLTELCELLPAGRAHVVSVHNFCPVPPEHKCSWATIICSLARRRGKKTGRPIYAANGRVGQAIGRASSRHALG